MVAKSSKIAEKGRQEKVAFPRIFAHTKAFLCKPTVQFLYAK
jgi:hypothetical protein